MSDSSPTIVAPPIRGSEIPPLRLTESGSWRFNEADVEVEDRPTVRIPRATMVQLLAEVQS